MQLIDSLLMKDELEKLFREDEDPVRIFMEDFQELSELYGNVQRLGDAALREYMMSRNLPAVIVEESGDFVGDPGDDEAEGEGSEDEADYLEAVQEVYQKIIEFYEHQKVQSWFYTGNHSQITGQRYLPIERVAVVMPRHWERTPLTLMMCLVPPVIAGVKEIYLNLPPSPADEDGVHPIFPLICHKLGVERIFRLPEEAAVIAFSCGTDSVPEVDKIVGAGGRRARNASFLVAPRTASKILSTRNETVILADAGADTDYIIADLFARTEDPNIERIHLVTDSTVLATEVSSRLSAEMENLDDKDAVMGILRKAGAIILASSFDEAIELVTRHPAKHLSLFVEHPLEILARIRHAGAIYLGENTPAGMENYFAFASNLIPSGRNCRYNSALDIHDFLTRTPFVYSTMQSLKEISRKLDILSRKDKLPLHRRSFEIRLEEDERR